MRFIAIEGLDGAGKSTQIKLLGQHLQSIHRKFKFIHFPVTQTGIFGDLVARFLRGDLGKIDQVNPYLVALIYAGDRKDHAAKLYQWLDEGYTILVDRYVYSNIAFQCAKMDVSDEKRSLAKWIFELEYGYFKIPKPDINLYLDVPFEFTVSQLSENRTGKDRDYLKGQKDIHEENFDFQKRVRDVYYSQVVEQDDFLLIDCKGNDNKMLSAEKIFDKILEKLNFKAN